MYNDYSRERKNQQQKNKINCTKVDEDIYICTRTT